MKSGRIQVDGETVPISYIVRTSQKISHFVHRFVFLNKLSVCYFHLSAVISLEVTKIRVLIFR